ncbi:MAG TPA: hypothetical protein VMD29_12070 [Terracidiphilus sp.]|nr:hypothetical protein [Terracidiphilus sp.]
MAHPSAKKSHRRYGSAYAACLCACAGFLLTAFWGPAAAAAQQGQEPLANPLPHPTSIILPAANRAPDANDRMEMQDQRLKRASYEAANAERKRQLDSDSALLLKLASELKAEIDRTPPDMLSLSIVRKAEEIERLAHDVQVKMKLTVGTD